MSSLTLYCFPGACSQVSICALEQTDLPYDLKPINLPKNEQNSEAYLKISPLGKVPTLLIDNDVLTENAAILVYLNALQPNAGIFPIRPTPRLLAEIQSGLSFCGGTLHPYLRGFVNPQRLTEGDGEPVQRKSIQLLHKSFKYADYRIARQGWWIGQESIIDVYLNWAFSLARDKGFDVSNYPHLNGLVDRLLTRPAFSRNLEIEAKLREELSSTD